MLPRESFLSVQTTATELRDIIERADCSLYSQKDSKTILWHCLKRTVQQSVLSSRRFVVRTLFIVYRILFSFYRNDC